MEDFEIREIIIVIRTIIVVVIESNMILKADLLCIMRNAMCGILNEWCGCGTIMTIIALSISHKKMLMKMKSWTHTLTCKKSKIPWSEEEGKADWVWGWERNGRGK